MAMEYVAGRTIIAWCRECGSPLGQRLRLFIDVCSAVEYAHRNLVVHRDLKPGNVLVTEGGAVKLLDFGIAKFLAADDDAATQNAPITPGYAAPEQILRGRITTATDVYALGMLLFELLTGERPWKLNALSLVAGIEKVLREAPPAPSEFARALDHAPVAPTLLRGDLDAIVLKAVRKEPERRYETVSALRADVERSLRREAVVAREGARLYAMGRFLRRHRVLVGSGGLIALACVVGAAGIAWQARVAHQEALQTAIESKKATAVKNFLLDIFKANSLQNPGGVRARNATAEQLLEVGADRIKVQLRADPEIREEVLDTLAFLYDDLGLPDRAAALARENLIQVGGSAGAFPNLQTVRAETRLAQILIDGGKDEDANRYLNAALAALDASGDRDSIERASVLFGLSRTAYDGTEMVKLNSRENLRTALDIVQRRDPANPLHGEILDYLGRFAKLDEDYVGAERWFRELLTFEEVPGAEANAYAIGNAYLNLGDDQALMRHFDDAEANLHQAVTLLQASAGANHPTTAMAMSRFGEMLYRAGRTSEALPWLSEALDAQQQTPQGRDDSTETRKTLGVLELARGRLGRAEQLLRQNLAQLKTGQDTELRYGVSAAVLASVLTAEGQLAEARRQYTLASDVFRRYIGENSLAYALNLIRGGGLELAEGNADEAERIFQAVLQRWPPRPGQFPDQYTKAVLGLSRAQLDRGRAEMARATAGDLLDRIRASPERSRLQDQEAQALRLMGDALIRSGRAVEAEAALRRAVQLRSMVDDAASPWLAESRITLARCLLAQNQSAEARKLLDLAAAAHNAEPRLGLQYRYPLRDAQEAVARSHR
jgi:serine/threonine-protein kinase